MRTNKVENTESIYDYTLSTMYRGVKISGLSCKKLRFRSYFQSLPSRVSRRTAQHITNAICARQTSIEIDVSHHHFEIRSEYRPGIESPVSSFSMKFAPKAHDQIAIASRNMCKFIRERIRYISIIILRAPINRDTIGSPS